MTLQEQKDYQLKVINWFHETYDSIYKAGGNPSIVLSHLNPDTLLTFVNNNLHITYRKP